MNLVPNPVSTSVAPAKAELWQSLRGDYARYDVLQRLVTAQTTQTPTPAAPQWGDSYSFDGFGSLTDITPIGTGLNLHINVDAATNRQQGWAYDANGNDVGASLSGWSRAYNLDNEDK